jgi:hypothetical protein
MAIVLVIIGIILGAVARGKDLQRTAEYQKIYQKFITQWVVAYDVYYTRTGVVLGDSQIEPRFMVAGASVFYPLDGDKAGIPGEAITEIPGKICHGQGYSRETSGEGDAELAVSSGTGDELIDMDLFNLMDRIGISMPPGRTEGREDRYLYVDTNGNPQELQVCFQWNRDGFANGSGNMMVLRGLTPDLARELDQKIDGKADAREGRFRQQSLDVNTVGIAGRAGVEWGANNTFRQGGQEPTSGLIGSNRDEDRVILVTAHFKMNQ